MLPPPHACMHGGTSSTGALLPLAVGMQATRCATCGACARCVFPDAPACCLFGTEIPQLCFYGMCVYRRVWRATNPCTQSHPAPAQGGGAQREPWCAIAGLLHARMAACPPSSIPLHASLPSRVHPSTVCMVLHVCFRGPACYRDQAPPPACLRAAPAHSSVFASSCMHPEGHTR